MRANSACIGSSLIWSIGLGRPTLQIWVQSFDPSDIDPGSLACGPSCFSRCLPSPINKLCNQEPLIKEQTLCRKIRALTISQQKQFRQPQQPSKKMATTLPTQGKRTPHKYHHQQIGKTRQ